MKHGYVDPFDRDPGPATSVTLYDARGNVKATPSIEPAILDAVSVVGAGFKGAAVVELYHGDPADGVLKETRTIDNLITDAGDLYYAGMAIALVTPAAPAQPTKMNGMKLGTGTTAVAKSGAGAALVTYLTASNVAFDSTWPVTSNLGAGLGVLGQYKTTWGAGVATNAAITEAVIVNDQATNATTTAANTSHRIVFTAINKLAADSLVITWSAKFLGV